MVFKSPFLHLLCSGGSQPFKEMSVQDFWIMRGSIPWSLQWHWGCCCPLAAAGSVIHVGYSFRNSFPA